jgi:hypothetical protein
MIILPSRHGRRRSFTSIPIGNIAGFPTSNDYLIPPENLNRRTETSYVKALNGRRAAFPGWRGRLL